MKLVPGATDKSVAELKYIVEDWAKKRNVHIPALSIAPHPADLIPGKIDRASKLDDMIRSIKDAVETAKSGIGVNMGALETRLSISGATAKLGPFEANAGLGGVTVETGKNSKLKTKYEVGWDGEMKLSTSYDSLKLAGAIGPKAWSMTLTFNTDKMPPYPAAIGKIFHEGEKGVRGILKETATFSHIRDIPDLAGRIKPHVEPVKKAVSTAGTLAGLKDRVSVGLEVKGPLSEADPIDKQRGTTVQGVITILF